MPKTKISEFSATANSNTDINSINIAEGCAPSNINDAIRELMAELKDFQAGTKGDSFNGPVGTSTAAAGAFTTLSASSTVSGTGFSTYLASPPAIGGTAAAAGSFTTLTTSSTVTLNGGTANGVAYLNGSKVLTSGSALTFDGNKLAIQAGSATANRIDLFNDTGNATLRVGYDASNNYTITRNTADANIYLNATQSGAAQVWQLASSEGMRLTSTGLGIGTSSPSQKLHVLADTSGALFQGATLGGITLLKTGQTGMQLFSDATGTLKFYDNNAGATVLNLSSGNLGLGVTPSASTIVQFEGGSNLLLVGRGNAYLSNNATFNSGFKYINTAAAGQYNISGGAHSWSTAASGTAGNAITFTQAMTLDASGNLGIGVTSPDVFARGYGRVLGVSSASNSAIEVNSATGNSAFFDLGVNSVRVFSLQTDASASYVQTLTSIPLIFSTANTERARIDSSGNLLVGQTTTSKTNNGVQIYSASGNNGRIDCSKTASGLYSALANYYNGTYIGGVDYSNSATSFPTSSDVRLKKDIVDAPSASAKIDQIRIVSHGWKHDDSTVDFGVVAQELYEIAPQAISKGDDGEEIEKTWGVDYSKLVPMLIKAHQEQQALIVELKSRIEVLEAK